MTKFPCDIIETFIWIYVYPLRNWASRLGVDKSAYMLLSDFITTEGIDYL